MFLATKHRLNPVIQPDLDSDSEIIWAKIDIPGLKYVLVGSFYKPTENYLESLRGLRDSLSKIHRSSLIWLLGDFNLPQIDRIMNRLNKTAFIQLPVTHSLKLYMTLD